MGIRIPKNQVITSKYTAGGEYMVESTYREYQGYYYELNGKTLAGKEISVDSPVLVPIPKNNSDINFLNFNALLTKASTYVYGKISGVKVVNSKFTPLTKLENNITGLDNIDTNEGIDTYYAKKLNNNIIKKIDENTFKNLQSDPLYKTTIIKADRSNLDQAEKQIPGITLFIEPTPKSILPTIPVQPETQINPLPTFIPPTGSITDTPKPQDIIPVGPIYYMNCNDDPPPIACYTYLVELVRPYTGAVNITWTGCSGTASPSIELSAKINSYTIECAQENSIIATVVRDQLYTITQRRAC